MPHITSQNCWQNKCAVITGASSGIGRALAWELGRHGAKLGLIARREESLQSLVEELAAEQIIAAYEVADVSDVFAVQRAVSQFQVRFGVVDVAIASAGIYRLTPGVAFDAAVVNEVVMTNFGGVANLFAAVIPSMVARRSGHLVAISSIAGLLGLPGAAAYSASKAAVIKMCDSLRLDLHASGVRVTTICPGFVDTPMITDEERHTLKQLVSAPNAAIQIRRAIERGLAQHSFPWTTWLEATLASWLPASLYRRAMTWFGEMEDATKH